MAEAIADRYACAGLGLGEILEVSTASDEYETGKALSAINLMYEDFETSRIFCVENWFQAAKVYERDGLEFGPYDELLSVRTPKRYLNQYLDKKIADQYADDDLFQKIHSEIEGASLARFELWGKRFPLVPRSCFYDYLYAKALSQERNRTLAERICNFRVFTDIMFTPGAGKRQKFNTQARSCAIFVSLTKRGLIDDALFDIETFVDLVQYEAMPGAADNRVASEQMAMVFDSI